jgi:hypothetical protein
MNGTAGVIAAVQSGDVRKLRARLATGRSLAAARDGSGFSGTMHAHYRRRKDMVDLRPTRHRCTSFFLRSDFYT